MKSKLFSPQRYQVNKEGARAVLAGHPWIFRTHLSTAASKFADGQWLKLFDGANQAIGYGIYDSDGLIAIRVLKRGSQSPTLNWIQTQLEKALGKRGDVRKYSDAFRAIHGENDGFPGVVIDIYGTTLVLQTYSPSVDAIGRYLAAVLAKRFECKAILWKLPAKRKRTAEESVRILRGKVKPPIWIREGKQSFAIDPLTGQKSGAFLDLRGLRKWTAAQDLKGKRVLNLFSYSGTLASSAEHAGAKDIVSVDIAEPALEFSRKYHGKDAKKHKHVKADAFKWVSELGRGEQFDLIISDPPMMASAVKQVPKALATYTKLYRSLATHVAPGGLLIAACCTSRIARKRFTQVVSQALGAGFEMRSQVAPEEDHPVSFSEGDYLKILVYRRKK